MKSQGWVIYLIYLVEKNKPLCIVVRDEINGIGVLLNHLTKGTNR